MGQLVASDFFDVFAGLDRPRSIAPAVRAAARESMTKCCGLTIDVIVDEAALHALAPEWEALHLDMNPRAPFASSLWCIAWWRSYRRDSLAASDHLQVYTLRDVDGRLVGVAPMFVTRRPGRSPICTRELQFFGADANVTEWRGPVCRPQDAEAVCRALAARVETGDDYDWVQWRGMTFSGEGEALGAGFRPEAKLDTVDYFLPLPGDWETFRSQLPRNIKESLRKCYNSLARDNHAFEMRVVRSPREAPDAVEQFLDLHAARAKALASVEHPNIFSSEESRVFLREYCQAMAERGDLAVFQLYIGGQLVATRIGFVFGGELYLYYSGYDVNWGRYSVMTTAVAEAIKWAIANGFSLVNLSTGSDVSKTRWRPEQVAFRGGYSVAKGSRGQAAFALVDGLRHGYARTFLHGAMRLSRSAQK